MFVYKCACDDLKESIFGRTSLHMSKFNSESHTQFEYTDVLWQIKMKAKSYSTVLYLPNVDFCSDCEVVDTGKQPACRHPATG